VVIATLNAIVMGMGVVITQALAHHDRELAARKHLWGQIPTPLSGVTASSSVAGRHPCTEPTQ
jgi:hypothetical protein